MSLQDLKDDEQEAIIKYENYLEENAGNIKAADVKKIKRIIKDEKRHYLMLRSIK